MRIESDICQPYLMSQSFLWHLHGTVYGLTMKNVVNYG
ncbi:hypothetical protein YPPY15_2326 [Yersinia pestis PY-15]|uniref:Uncharacterized protein n=1 Tax=Yersinia pestis PY-08 TaxID=992134 RepID=A0AB72ZKL6_YERPE|nr:hypothetical protein YPPY07_2249 [Yersinia pestis PY-07]EIR18867.1 hypothetical protein YPPY08_2364 [Yersinia pestis PY-08]EIR47568.1 hypothetical protein YPPY15_2326 [Yersinia pestis PY-15]EIT40591.1 hypothetical protein YPPY99_2472 [Yersinia pestis PY-99]